MKSIERVSVTDEVAKRIKAEILGGRYRQGDRLATEKELSEELGVGRSTVREALRMLKAYGFIQIQQGRGAFVLKTVEDSEPKIRDWFAEHEYDLRDLMEIRFAFEPLAVKLAVARAGEDEVRKIGEALSVFETATVDGTAIDLAESDALFHSLIIEASHNRLLSMISGKLDAVFEEYRLRSFSMKENVKNALQPHRNIFRAIQERNAEAGILEMRRHLEISLDDINSVIQDPGKPARFAPHAFQPEPVPPSEPIPPS